MTMSASANRTGIAGALSVHADWTTSLPDVASGNDSPPTQFVPDIPDKAMTYIRLSLMVVVLMPVSSFGILANILNVRVYLKLKMSDSITVELLGLSLSDLAGSILSLFTSICFLVLESWPDLAVDPYSLVYIIASGARGMFNNISLTITVCMSVERCVAVIMPLTFKNSFSPSASVKTISLLTLLICICFVPIYATRGLAWQYDKRTNSSRLLAFYTDEREKAETFLTIFLSITWNTLAHLIVLASTFIMIHKLKHALKFRQRATEVTKSGDVMPSSLTTKDRSMIRMVMAISWILIVCNLPSLSYTWARNFVPQLRSSKGYRNLTTTIFALANIGMCINASVNIFAYYNLGSKYRTCFRSLFCRKFG